MNSCEVPVRYFFVKTRAAVSTDPARAVVLLPSPDSTSYLVLLGLGKMVRNFGPFPVNTILVSSRNALATLPASRSLTHPIIAFDPPMIDLDFPILDSDYSITDVVPTCDHNGNPMRSDARLSQLI